MFLSGDLLAFVLIWLVAAVRLSRGGEHQGCHVDLSSSRLLPHMHRQNWKDNSVDNCIHACAVRHRTYAGVEYGNECFCGDSHNFSRHGRVRQQPSTGDKCDMPCRGNRTQTCGGTNLIEVYSVCPRGRYHRRGATANNCDGECHCGGSHICFYSTGQCPHGCQHGWYRTSCSVRVSTSTVRVIDLTRSTAIPTIVVTSDTSRPIATTRATAGYANGNDEISVVSLGLGLAVGLSIAAVVLCTPLVDMVVRTYRKRPIEKLVNCTPTKMRQPPELVHVTAGLQAKRKTSTHPPPDANHAHNNSPGHTTC